MKGLIQRVSKASVTVDGDVVGQIEQGLLLLLGVEKSDDETLARKLCRRVSRYRVFPDDLGRMNLSLMDCGGSLLVVPQFTLVADTRSGNRPGFSEAGAPEHARHLFEVFSDEAASTLGEGRVATGRFGADMKVSLVNEGPVTFALEARN
ncbi:D-aminoacyl-tRNA deacylase [Marinobacter sp. CHS3-4]|uniref:D-aminoacyl-tRNA deacylase n=1 Tax=Marinobacter sp. CHS3-4 TaxID=3045174 RepID=UPI0024B48636|nr:D-aminoacyl-tRNA deacylase [Marinobacter sp. CHS3-4]MDI9246687.1 D-aminoacyl-tRNA deacylase [Marinobacter sp. CHS3-4]